MCNAWDFFVFVPIWFVFDNRLLLLLLFEVYFFFFLFAKVRC